MWLWIVLVVLAVMAALLIYAACCVDGDIDRQSEAHPPKPEKGRDDGKVSMRCLSLHPGNVALHSCRALLSMKRALSVLLYGLRRWLELATRSMKNSMW